MHRLGMMLPIPRFEHGAYLIALFGALATVPGSSQTVNENGTAVPPPAGIVTLEIGPKLLLGEQGIGPALMRAYLKPPGNSSRTYRVWQLSEMDQELEQIMARSPKPRGLSGNGAQAIDGYAHLKAGFDACALEAGTNDKGPCFAAIGGADYENALGDPMGFALSRYRGYFNGKLGAGDRILLERELTGLLGQIRRQMQEGASPSQQVYADARVIVGAKDDLNISTRFGSGEVVFGEGAIRTIFEQSLHRALYSSRRAASELELYDECETCDDADDVPGSYLVDPERLDYFRSKFPNVKYSALSNRWFAAAVRSGCASKLTPDLEEQLDSIAENEDDLRSLISRERIESLGACANDGTTRLSATDLRNYLDEIERAAESDQPENWADLMMVMTEGMLFQAALSAELSKSFAFLLGHEAYHQWISERIGSNAELSADEHAAATYLTLFPQIDLAAWYGPRPTSGIGLGVPDGEGFGQGVMQAVMGREPSVLLRELYNGARFRQGDGLHPPVEQRVAAVTGAIAAGRIKLSCETFERSRTEANRFGLDWWDDAERQCPARGNSVAEGGEDDHA